MAQRTLPPNFHSHEYGGVIAPVHFTLVPAYTLLPFLRRPIGIHLVSPFTVLLRTFLMIILPPVLIGFYVGITLRPVSRAWGHEWFVCFALAYAALALATFAWRWIGQRRGEELHSSEAGYSWLVRLTPLPVGLCEQILVPFLVWVVGYGIDHSVSKLLGWWFMAGAASLFIMGRWEGRRRWTQQQSTVDDVIRAKTYEDRMAWHEATQRVSPATPDAPVFADLSDDEPTARPRPRR
jgi:hypothetical protein